MPTWEDELPPLAKSRLSEAGEAGPEERNLAKQRNDVQSLLADFYRDDLDPYEMRRKLGSGTTLMVVEAQKGLIGSLSLSCDSRGFERCRAAILELESLKENRHAGLIEGCLNRIGDMQKAYREAQESTLQEVTEERSRSHQATITPGRWIALHGMLSTDADMAERLAESMLQAERNYGHEFASTIQQLTALIDPGR